MYQSTKTNPNFSHNHGNLTVWKNIALSWLHNVDQGPGEMRGTTWRASWCSRQIRWIFLKLSFHSDVKSVGNFWYVFIRKLIFCNFQLSRVCNCDGDAGDQYAGGYHQGKFSFSFYIFCVFFLFRTVLDWVEFDLVLLMILQVNLFYIYLKSSVSDFT